MSPFTSTIVALPVCRVERFTKPDSVSPCSYCKTAEGAPPLGFFQDYFCRLDDSANRVANFQFHFLGAAAGNNTFDNYFARADDDVRHDVAEINFFHFSDNAVAR